MAGMIVTWLQKTEKLSSPSAAARSTVIAVDGVVVSKPMAMNTTRLSGFCRAIFSESSGEYTMRMSVPGRLGVEERAPGCPGTRIMSPNEVMMVSGWDGQADGVVHPAHRDDADRAARAVHQRDRLGQVVLEAVLVDGVRVPAAHLHQLVLPPGLAQLRDLRGQRVRLVGVAELINEPHAVPAPIRSGIPAARLARPRRPGRSPPGTPARRRPPLSSILDSAKPTWMSTHSPGLGGSSASRPMLITRLTPLTSTLARSG